MASGKVFAGAVIVLWGLGSRVAFEVREWLVVEEGGEWVEGVVWLLAGVENTPPQ